MAKKTKTRGRKPGRKRRTNKLTSGSGLDEPPTALDQYLRDVSRHELITPERERELGAKAQNGDKAAINALVRANLRLVIIVAKKYQNRGVSLTDLIQEGNVGLVTAAHKFDPEQGVKFISYAIWWIRQAILASLANYGRQVRVPLEQASDLARIFREKERLKREKGKEPTSEELGRAANLPPELVDSLQALNAPEIRLDAPIGDSEDSQLVERFVTERAAEPEAEVENRLLTEAVTGALDEIALIDALVLQLYFGLQAKRRGRHYKEEEIKCFLSPLDAVELWRYLQGNKAKEDDKNHAVERTHTPEEIGKLLGIPGEWICELRDRGLKQLREGEQGKVLRSWINGATKPKDKKAKAAEQGKGAE